MLVLRLFHTDNPEELGNCRPIALLSVLTEINEDVIKTRLLIFLNRTFFSPQKYSFTKGTNTADAMSDLLGGVCRALNKREKAAGLFIDFSKGFHLVDHEVSLHKSDRTSIRGLAKDLFTSCLPGRFQRVQVDG